MNRWALRPKHKRKAMPEWIAFVVSLNCLICKAPCEFSHTMPKAAKGACSDVLGHGICPVHHRTGDASIHALGSIEAWQEYHKIDLNEALIMYWTMFLELHGLNIDEQLVGLTDRNSVVSKMESLIKELI